MCGALLSFVLLSAIAASTVEAQAGPPPALPPGYEVLSSSAVPPPPPGVQLAAPGARAPAVQTHVGAELGGWALGALLGTGAAFGTVAIAVSPCFFSSRSCDESALVLAFTGAVAMYTFAIPAGVYFAGNAAGGRGGFGYTLLGHLGGMAVGGLLAAICAGASDASNSDGIAALGGVLWYVSGAVGSILGYELSSAGAMRAAPSQTWVPTAMPTAHWDGLVLGVAAAF